VVWEDESSQWNSIDYDGKYVEKEEIMLDRLGEEWLRIHHKAENQNNEEIHAVRIREKLTVLCIGMSHPALVAK
jgi:hypothetical protein